MCSGEITAARKLSGLCISSSARRTAGWVRHSPSGRHRTGVEVLLTGVRRTARKGPTALGVDLVRGALPGGGAPQRRTRSILYFLVFDPSSLVTETTAVVFPDAVVRSTVTVA